MAIRHLPERPNLDQLKRQAKDLVRDARAGDRAARARFRLLPAFARESDAEFAAAAFALHDAQSVVAREQGFDSWNAMRERVEELTLEFGAAVDEFIAAATSGRRGRAERLLALHPGVAHANLYAALVAGDAVTVGAALDEDPTRATTAGGPRGWEPIHYVCHSTMAGDPQREAGLVASLRRLIACGADPNTRFPWLHHGVRRPVLWGALLATRSLALGEALLDVGADPSDGVTLTLAAGLGETGILELLLDRGADPNVPWATNGAAPIYEVLQWAQTDAGVRLLLARGADPDPVSATSGETPMHLVAAAWGVELAEDLLRRGADPARPRADGRTPYAVAELNGNRAVADWLAAHGAASALAPVDRLVAACRRGDREAVDAMLAASPDLASRIAPEHYRPFYRAAEQNDVAALDAMLACGFDPDRPDESIGKTALHAAAMEGWPDAVRLLVERGASVHARDHEFKATPLIWAAEGSRTWREGRDHAAVGRILIAAGSPAEWDANESPSEEILDIVDSWRGLADQP